MGMRTGKVAEVEEDEVTVVVKKKETTVTQQVKEAGRPMVGKTKATNKIAFMVDDETLAYLETLTDKKNRTPNAVAKKLLMSNYEIHGKKS
jgi:hypothetical protein